MKLYYTKGSPFATVVRLALAKTDLVDTVELVQTTVRDQNSELLKYSPSGKVPALLLDDGQVLMESRLVCQYLDTFHHGQPFVAPADDVKALAVEALATSFCDGLAVWVRELRKDESLRSAQVIAHEAARAERCLKAFETQALQLEQRLGYGNGLLACALLMLDNALPLDWQQQYPALYQWWSEAKAQLPL